MAALRQKRPVALTGFGPWAAVIMTSEYAARLAAGPLQRGLDGDGAEIMGPGGGERAVETRPGCGRR